MEERVQAVQTTAAIDVGREYGGTKKPNIEKKNFSFFLLNMKKTKREFSMRECLLLACNATHATLNRVRRGACDGKLKY